MTSSAGQWLLALAFGIGACFSGEVRAQDSTRPNGSTGVPEEEILELIDDEEASASVAEMLSFLRENPVDLNSAQRDELLSIPGVTTEEADAILRLRNLNGSFASINDIRDLTDGEKIVGRLRPYVFVQHATARTGIHHSPLLLFSSRLSGFVPGTEAASALGALGTPARLISRLAVNVSRHVKFGLLFEKDAGERMSDGFPSGFISYRGNGVLEQVVLGDFSAEAGQGLVLWRGSSFGGSVGMADGIRRHSARVIPYQQTDEAHYLRGGAAALKGRILGLSIRCSLLASRASLAARLNEQGDVTSFYSGGLYTTAKELETRNAVHELLTGIHLECGFAGRGTIGWTYCRSVFDRSVHQASPNAFSGVKSEVIGADFSVPAGRLNFFGECARTATGGMAWMAGLVIPLDSLFRVSIACRDYSPDFDNPHASAYGVQTNTTNERGISIGWSVRLVRAVLLEGRADQCKIPASTYVSFLPRSAASFLVQATAIPASGMRLSFSFRTRKGEEMQSRPDLLFGALKVQGNNERTSARFAAGLVISRFLEMKIRIEHVESRYSRTGRLEKGNLVSQTVRFGARGLECEGGAAFFESDSYDARIYDYEGNLRGSVASPALYGSGSRWHLLASWESTSWMRLAAKYAVVLVEKRPVAKEFGGQVEIRF